MAYKEIDPDLLGYLEVQWWRAHNDKNTPRLFSLLVEQNVALYGFGWREAEKALKYLMGAVSDHDTRNWVGAIGKVEVYYQKVKDQSGLNFDPKEVAKLEVGWWRIHDQLEDNPDKPKLANAFSKLYATLFGVDVNKMGKAGRIKAQATVEHDLAENSNTPTDQIETHWKKAQELLTEFYSEIKKVLV